VALPAPSTTDGTRLATHLAYQRPANNSLSVQTSQLSPAAESAKPLPSPRTLLTPPYATADVAANNQYSMTRESSTKSSPAAHVAQSSPLSMTEPEAAPARLDNPPSTKPKRVRTGCLTCRERHLKCDEGLPNCQNCKKSNRKCKRGVRLNFIDIQCESPPYTLPPTHDWQVTFQDDSRDIASEYQGGLERYHPLEPEPKRQRVHVANIGYDYSQLAAPLMGHQELPKQQYSNTYAEQQAMFAASHPGYDEQATSMAPFAEPTPGLRQPYPPDMMDPEPEQTAYVFQDPQELLYMQVFVEEVGVWMDSMDPDKHFSRVVPFQATRQPMLRYALLACGIRHLNLVNARYPEEDAYNYYNNATQLLLKSLQNPDRNSVLCATTATILNVYEVMSEKALQRMNHIAGARALIKECGWDATSKGLGAACFWLNVGLELFSCMHFNWSVAWDPDLWGVDLNFEPQLMGGHEEEWTHRMLWLLSKITNFRAEACRRHNDESVHAEQQRLEYRQRQWNSIKFFCDEWQRCIPPTMHPLGHVPAHLTRKRSTFPEIWFIKRATIVAQLFYHTGRALLASVHPLAAMQPEIEHQMAEVRLHHSRTVCGIVAHVKDRGVASASIRCLAASAENLVDRAEQEEVLQIFDRIKLETGWRVDFIHDDLREKWGWAATGSDYDNMSAASSTTYYVPSVSSAPNAATPPRPKYPLGIVNPLYKNADFSAQNPPYQGSYVPPTANAMHDTMRMYGFSGIPAL
jgi:hypothetical protein